MTAAAGIVLAAGLGRRMGGAKALLVVDGKPLLLAHVQRMREVGCRPIVVVARASNVVVLRGMLGDVPEARLIVADTDSMAASLAIGLGCLTPEASQPIVISPVDTLPVSISTLNALLTAVAVEGVQVATPCFRGRGGHPVVARESLLQEFRHGYSGTLRDLIRRAESQRRRLEVDDPAVVGSLDTPADLAAVRPGSLPHFVSSSA